MKYVIDVPDIDRYLLPSETRGSIIGIPMSVDNHECIISTDIKYIGEYIEPDKNVKNNGVNLCKSCNRMQSLVPCPANGDDILFGEDGESICCCKQYVPETTDRKSIEDEVWEFVNKLLFTKYDDIKDCFGSDSSFIQVLKKCSYQEAKSKYIAWKKQNDEIRIGDEVKHKQYEWKAFVINISEYGLLTLMCGLGEASNGFDPEEFEKTGKHCAEVEKLIKKISEYS